MARERSGSPHRRISSTDEARRSRKTETSTLPGEIGLIEQRFSRNNTIILYMKTNYHLRHCALRAILGAVLTALVLPGLTLTSRAEGKDELIYLLFDLRKSKRYSGMVSRWNRSKRE